MLRRAAGSRAGAGLDEPALRAGLDRATAAARVVARWGGDLCGLLNAMTRGELVQLLQALNRDA